ncbi:MAG: hypothetical protein ABEJ58_05705 [Halodesulfurarchaeum sp.]
MDATQSDIQQTLLIERVASLYRIDRLAALLPVDIYPPYLLLFLFFFIDFVAVNTYKMMTGYEHILLATPTVIAGPIGIVLAAIGIRYMSANYSDAIEYLHQHNRGPDTDLGSLEQLVSVRTKWVVFGIAAASEYAYLIFVAGIESVVEFEGVAGLVNVLFVHEFGYLPFVAEFAVIFFSIHFLVPKRINDADINLFHYDPRNMGGFAAIGQLLKRSYYLYTAGLLLYLVLIYGPFITSFGKTPVKPGLTAALFFSAAWLVGLVSIAYSMFRMHQIMAKKKETRIRELEEELNDVIDAPHDINSSAIADQERFEDVKRRLDQVRSTKVYPATFTMWSQIAISVILPQFLQFAVRTTA